MASTDTATNTQYDNRRGIKKVKKREKPRINDDWRYLEEEETKLPKNSTIDQKFNLNYKHQGIKKLKVEKPKKAEKYTDSEGNVIQNYQIPIRTQISATQASDQQQTAAQRKLKLKNKLHRRKARIINNQIRVWYMFYWSTLNIFLALLSILGLTLISIVVGIASSENFLAQIATSVVGFISSGISGLLGINITNIGAMIFSFPYFLLIGINVLFMLLTGFLHKLAGNNPLFGRHGGAKIGSVIIMFIGISVPILNLFPWLLFWLAVISKYPR